MTKQVNSVERLSRGQIEGRTTKSSDLEYLVDILPQLRRMALSLDEKTLAYLLEMAMLEASLVLDIDQHTNLVASIQRQPS